MDTVKAPCQECGKLILPSTLERTGGKCMPCVKKSNPLGLNEALWERFIPVPSPEDAARIQTVRPQQMLPMFSFSPVDGSVQIEGCPTIINKGLSKDLAASSFSKFYRTSIDHRNGYEWLAFQGVSFGGHPCSFSLGFYMGQLEQIHFGVALPDANIERGWPTRETIDAEITFVRKILANTFARSFSSGQELFGWGGVWSVFDAKGIQASSGVRYAA